MEQEQPNIGMRFKSPEEELQYLRAEVARKEAALRAAEKPVNKEELISEEVKAYKAVPAEAILDPALAMSESETSRAALDISHEKPSEALEGLFAMLDRKGVKNTLSVVEKLREPDIADDFHKLLIQRVKQGLVLKGVKEQGPDWEVLHTTLYEVSLPDPEGEEGAQAHSLKELISAMEQFYSGMLSISEDKGRRRHFTLEIAVADKNNDIVFYIAVPDKKKTLFEQHIQALFPDVNLVEQLNDYNIFVPNGESRGASAKLKENPVYPIRTYEEFDHDPLNVILNTFSKIERDGGGAALQVVFKPQGEIINKKYKAALQKIRKGKSLKEAIDITYTASDEVVKFGKEMFKGLLSAAESKKKDESSALDTPDQKAVEGIERKTGSPIIGANLRVVTSAKSADRAEEILGNIMSAFNQFNDPQANAFSFKDVPKRRRSVFFKAFSFREYNERENMYLNLKEVTSIIHLPTRGGSAAAPQFKQSKAGSAPAPGNLSREGLLLGHNRYRNVETPIRLAADDRLRHLYVIGQTGTGKTTFLKNLIIQDILAGEGVCMIDPHGTDIEDVLAMVPRERFDDLIYFDPGYTKRVMALNMLEYDPAYPEQKTFVVNELFSIFQKLYSNIPESMGPAFEQYFRNSTLLVMEDPASGNTLIDVSRVLADPTFREMKLSRCKNPLVKQFWMNAEQTTGEQALANYVQYVTNKFDVFLANDIMRPLIAQETSSFSFRKIMDERKILLVNLSKGRLGDINANLLGLILVGKILLAALSRADSVGRDFPPFYLYIDEFQNVTTNSIATILSEARKYKLSLTVAHQFIAQLEENIRDAVFGNVGSMAAFRVGAEDAEFLKSQFEPTFEPKDLVNIDNRKAYVKMLANGIPAKPFDISVPTPPQGNPAVVGMLRELSYMTYGRPRDEVENEILERYRAGGFIS